MTIGRDTFKVKRATYILGDHPIPEWIEVILLNGRFPRLLAVSELSISQVPTCPETNRGQQAAKSARFSNIKNEKVSTSGLRDHRHLPGMRNQNDMKSDLKCEFLSVWRHGDSYRATWRTYGGRFKITGQFKADGSTSFDVYEHDELIELGWSTLRRAKLFVDRFAAGKTDAFSETRPPSA